MVLEGYTECCEWNVCLALRLKEKIELRHEREVYKREKPLKRAK